MTQLPPDYDPRVYVDKKHAGSSVLYLFYYLPNGQRRNVSARTKSKMQANSLAKEKTKALLEGRFTPDEQKLLGDFIATELSIEAAIERYFAITGRNKTAKTLDSERPAINAYFVKYFSGKRGARMLKDITPAMVNDLVHQHYGDRPQATRNFVRRTVSKLFRALIREGTFVGDNPVERSQPVPMARKQRSRDVWIPQEHFLLLLEAAKTSKSALPLHDMLELNWELALRTDEILTLEWSQIDFDERLLHIVVKPDFPTEFGRGWAPKWQSERHLPLTDKAVEVLRRQPRRLTAGTVGKTRELVPTNLVFPRRTRWEGRVVHLRANGFRKAFQTVTEKAGLGQCGYHWHDMRRSWNRMAAERGIPLSYRAAFLGHREEVNESNYETAMAMQFMRERMAQSMVSDQATAVPNLFQLAPGDAGR